MVMGDERQKVAGADEHLVTPADHGAGSPRPIDHRLPLGPFREVDLADGIALDGPRPSRSTSAS